MKKDDIYRAAYAKWGTSAQQMMLIEEMGELMQAMSKMYRLNSTPSALSNLASVRSHFIEEIADVQIMLEQTIFIHEIKKEVKAVMAKKLKRLSERVKP